MPTTAFARRAAAAAALAALTSALLTGCFSNPVEDLVNQGVEDAVEGATGGDVSLGGELPAGFPESIPLVEGEIALGAGTGGADGWVVVVDSNAADPVADAVTALEGAGFTKYTGLSAAGADAQVYSDGEYVVLVAGDGEKTVSYTVTPQPLQQ